VDAKLSAEDRKKLTRGFQISPEILKEAKVERITDAQARKRGFYLKDATEPFDGIFFPYLNSGAEWFNARLRRDVCEAKDDGSPANKYLMLPKSSFPECGLYVLPSIRRRLQAHEKIRVVIVEAEKSALAATAWARRTRQPNTVFVATGGCRAYNTPDLELLRGLRVDVLWDSNVWTSGDPQDSEPKLVNLLKQEYEADAGVLRLPRDSRAKGINGPDDYIAKKKDAAFTRLINGPRAEPWLDMVGVTWEAYKNTKPPLMAIEGFLQEGGVALFGGLPSAMKTWVLLSVAHALLTGDKLFGYFEVPRLAKRVIYLTPEVGLPMFKVRLERMGLGPYIEQRKLLVSTLSQPRIELTNPHLLQAAEDAYVFLDTIVRFTKGDENENKNNDTGLASDCFGLLRARARLVVGAHHARKDSNKDDMTLENMFRGAGDIGAFVRVGYGLRKLGKPTDPASTRVLIACVKPGDFKSPEPFIVEAAFINQGRGLQIIAAPGEVADRPHSGKPETPDKAEKVAWAQKHIADLAERGEPRPTMDELAARLNKTFKSSHTRDTLSTWLRKANNEKKLIEQTAKAAAGGASEKQ